MGLIHPKGWKNLAVALNRTLSVRVALPTFFVITEKSNLSLSDSLFHVLAKTSISLSLQTALLFKTKPLNNFHHLQ